MNCSVQGCYRKVLARKMCGMHYQRWSKYGDPAVCLTKKPEHGAIDEWFAENIDAPQGPCIIWPFARKSDGRAHMGRGGKTLNPARVMCGLVWGPPPTEEHETAHGCGKGHWGCVHPKHVRWATTQENHAEKIEHKTLLKGEALPQAILTEGAVRSIRKLRGKKLQAEIAAEFGVSRAHVSAVLNRKNWKHVND